MVTLAEGKLLWTPSEDFKRASHMARYMDWLVKERGLTFADYDALWRWSVGDLEAFWESICGYFDIRFHRPCERVLASRDMPGARWFPGSTLNYAEHVFRNETAEKPAILFASETRALHEISWRELKRQVACLAQALRGMGVQSGDKVAAYMPNIPETIVAFLATISIGAVWSLCSPDVGKVAAEDRFKQIEPKILVAADGYRYGGRDYDRSETVRDLAATIPKLENLIIVPALHGSVP